jgi:hypothetical protein
VQQQSGGLRRAPRFSREATALIPEVPAGPASPPDRAAENLHRERSSTGVPPTLITTIPQSGGAGKRCTEMRRTIDA